MSSPDPAAGPRLENRLAPDDARGRAEQPLRELAWLLAATLGALGLAAVLLAWAAQALAPHLPFSAEVALAESLLPDKPASSAADQARRDALQTLAERMAGALSLPAGMTVSVTDEPRAEFNAYATLGGRIRVFHGVLAQVQHEEELAALLAHEIAHIKHRHVAANLGRGTTMALLLSVVSSEAGAGLAQALLGQAAHLALLGYSREQERQADADALRASVALYGHAGGLLALLHRLEVVEQQHGSSPPGWLRSHPHGSDRLLSARALAQAQGWALSGAMQPLAAELRPADER